MNRHREDAPPAGMWLAVLMLVALFVVPAYEAFRLGWLAEIGGRGNAASEWQRYRPDADATLVMAVGSSLLQAGVGHAELSTDDQSQWLLFNRGGGNYQNFVGLLHSQWPVQPQVLIVQTDMFLKEQADLKTFLTMLRTLSNMAIRWALVGALPAPDETPVYLASQIGEMKNRALALANLYHPDPAAQVQLIDWLRLQQSRGSRVVLLDIPRSPSVEKAMGAPLFQWRANMRLIAAKLQMPLLHFDGPLADTDFYDGSHMRPSGRTRHTRWLQQKVQELLRESH